MLLEIENLRIVYQKDQLEQVVVNGMNIHMKEGECIGIAGASGCGKTQSMLAIMGLLAKHANVEVSKALWKNEVLPIMNPKAMIPYQGHAITMIFQNAQTALDPVYTIQAQFAECLWIHKRMKRKDAYMEALHYLHKVKIPEPQRILKSYPHQLSLGMCQRVMLAMALCCRGELWILDEPTSSLDTIVQADIMELLMQIRKEEHKSMIFITHDLRLLPMLCDRIYIMRKGAIVEEIAAMDLFSKKAHHSYTKQLLADCKFAQK